MCVPSILSAWVPGVRSMYVSGVSCLCLSRLSCQCMSRVSGPYVCPECLVCVCPGFLVCIHLGGMADVFVPSVLSQCVQNVPYLHMHRRMQIWDIRVSQVSCLCTSRVSGLCVCSECHVDVYLFPGCLVCVGVPDVRAMCMSHVSNRCICPVCLVDVCNSLVSGRCECPWCLVSVCLVCLVVACVPGVWSVCVPGAEERCRGVPAVPSGRVRPAALPVAMTAAINKHPPHQIYSRSGRALPPRQTGLVPVACAADSCPGNTGCHWMRINAQTCLSSISNSLQASSGMAPN